VAVNSFGAIDISLTQLSVYDSANHYGTAIRRGTDNVPILKITITSTEATDVTWTELKLIYTGIRLADIGTNADLHGSGDVLISQRPFSIGTVTFPLNEKIPANGSKNYTVKLDIVSGAGSYYVTLGFVSASFAGLPDVVDAPFTNPDAFAFIDASPPGLDKYPTAIPNKYEGEYNAGTKILKLRFYDEKDPIGPTTPRVQNPLVRLVWADGIGPALSQVDLSKIQLRAPDDAPATNLSGAALLCPSLYLVRYYAAGSQPTEGNTFPDGTSAFSREVWIKLTCTQDVYLQNEILPDSSTGTDQGYKWVELYINGALWDAGPAPQIKPADGDFKNLIAEKADARILIIGDTTPPALVPINQKPVKFDSNTRVLTLTFTESIDAVPGTDVTLDKIYIFNYTFDEDGNVVIGSRINLTGATVTVAYGTTVTITLTSSQRDVLKGDHPQLELNAGAVKDVSGNPNLAATVNVCVTPPLLSGVETVYDGNLSEIVLDLKFTEEISMVDATKFTITNEKDESPFTLTSSEFDTIRNDENGIARIASFKITKAHRDHISYWQRADMKELRVKLDAGAVKDIYGASNEAMAQSERIGWVKDTTGPFLTNSSTYSHSTRLLKLRFNETLDLTPEGDETIADLVDSSKITLSNPINGDNFTLTNDELVPNQIDDWWLQYTLTIAHNDQISTWQATGATQINISVGSGAVKDLSRNPAPASTGVITSANWIMDTVRPTFVSAYYSGELRSLVIRFSESISNAPGLQPDLSKIKVHDVGKEPVGLGGDAQYQVLGDTLEITNLSNEAHNAIFDAVNPQVDLESGAVSDLSGNLISAIYNRPIVSDRLPPVTNLTASNRTDTTFDLTWTNPPDERFAGALIVRSQDPITWKPVTGVSYNIDEEVVPGVIVRFVGADDHSTIPFTDTGLAPSTIYYYKAFAYDTSHNYSIGTGTSSNPPLLSGADSVYDGNPATAVLDLKFTTEGISVVDATKFTITNEKGENPFALTSSEFNTIVQDDDEIPNIVRFLLSKAHKDSISYWQRAEMKELRVKLDAGAVTDVTGTQNFKMEESEKIAWTKDYTGPLLTNSSTYAYTRLLKLRFDETLDLTPEGDETISDLVDSLLITLSPVGGMAFGSVILTNDELMPNQTDDWWLQYTLTSAHGDEISNWSAAGATEIRISVESGAVFDLNRNLAPASTGVITAANWIRDTVRPTFVAAYYSVDLRSLVIRFSESITNPDLNKIKVHDAGKEPVGLGGDARYEVLGDALKITNLSDDAHNAIANVGNPQVDIGEAAVKDLAGNTISAIYNRPITYDVGGPTLSPTGNIYEHISLENDTLVTDGLLTLAFNEIVDVSTLYDLAKVKLAAGTTRISLVGAQVQTVSDAQTIKIKLTNDDTVGQIAGLQREYTTLYVELEAGAIKDLAGNNNADQYQVIEKWIGDTRKPELDYSTSYYIHDLAEHGYHYARLVLKFDEQMDTCAAYINFSGIVVANPGGDSITLRPEELKPDQGFSTEIQFNLTDDHRDTISDWGKPTAATSGEGKGYNELHISLAENSVSDRAGNSVVVKPVQKFAVAKADDSKTTDIDERKYPYSTWEKDLRPAEYVSSTYDANTKEMTITFDEWMDEKPKDATVKPELMTIKDKDELNPVVLAAMDYVEQEKTKTIKFFLTPEKDMAIKTLAEPLYLYLEAGAAVDFGGVPSAPATKKKITYTKDTVPPTFVSAYYSVALRTLVIRFSESISQPDLSKIRVHDAGREPKGLGADARGEILGDTLKITNLSDDAHNAIANVGNPQVNIGAGAVMDLAGNPISEFVNRPIVYDTGSPSPVANFTASNPTDTTINLKWTNPPDGDFAGALIVRSENSITWSPTAGVSYTIGQVVAEGVTVCYLDADDHSTTPFTDTGLTPYTTYYYRAFAYDFFFNYSTGVEDSETALLYGDVSGDGNVTAYDASLVLQFVVGLRNLSSVERKAADVTNDGNVTALDAALILQHTVGLITQFPVETTTAATPALSAKAEEDVLTKEIARLEATYLNSEQKKVLEQLKSLISKRLLPKHTALLQNYPNPFNPDTWLPYELAKDATVTIHIYNVKGQLVRQLNLGKQKAGSYIDKEKAAYWDGRDELGQAVSSGLYFYMLRAGDFQATKRMVIVK
jgi:hypothetical protein